MDYFTNLPNEILLDVFEHCRLLPLTLVCRKFNEIISNSPTLLKRVNLVISEKIPASNLVKSKRQHQAVLFKFNYKITEDSLDAFNKFQGIKSLEFMRCLINADLFLKMLEALPNLETLSIYTTFLKNKEKIDPPRLMNLKRLNFRNSDEKFLEYLQNSELRSLYVGFPPQSSNKILEEFLKSQTKVRAIEYLSVASVDDSLIKIIAQDMGNLTKLHLESDKIDMNLVGNLEIVNNSVKFLSLYGDFQNPGDINVVLSFFKSLEDLEIEMNNKLEPANILQLPNKLKSLSIIHCSGDYFNSITIRNLKIFKTTDGNFTSEEWSRLASRNPSIESITVKDESMTNETFRTISIDFQALKHFEMFFDPQRLTPDILDFIFDASFPRNIQILKIIQRSSPANPFFTLTENHKRSLNSRFGFKATFN